MGGADVDYCTDVLSNAPLLCAHAHLGHGDVVALLLDQGAQVKISIYTVYIYTHTIVWWYFELPVLHPQVDAQSHDGLTALGFAAAAGHLDIVTMLSQNAAKVEPHTGHKDRFPVFMLPFSRDNQLHTKMQPQREFSLEELN